jgi:hypothetical protein
VIRYGNLLQIHVLLKCVPEGKDDKRGVESARNGWKMSLLGRNIIGCYYPIFLGFSYLFRFCGSLWILWELMDSVGVPGFYGSLTALWESLFYTLTGFLFLSVWVSPVVWE